MDRMLGPTGAALVGTAFVCLILLMSQSVMAQPSMSDSLYRFGNLGQGYAPYQQDSDRGLLKLPNGTVCFPWASREVTMIGPLHPEVMPRAPPTKESVTLTGSEPEAEVQDLKAMNTVEQRDIVCEESQKGDPKAHGLVNFMGVSVRGKGQSKREWPDGADDLEEFVDNAVNSDMEENNKVYGKTDGGDPEQKLMGNYLNIDVKGVTVSAINTVEGGSAVATSNIVIKPVQVIVCPPEVEEKLK
jgi:hypothetical protein